MRFAFSRTSVAHLAAQLRRDEITFPESAVLDVASTTAGTPGYHPAGGHPLALEWSARRVAQVMGRGRPEELSELQQAYLARLGQAEETMGEAHRLTQGFLQLVLER